MRYLIYLLRLLKDMKNPSFFIYHLFHYSNRNIPYSFAKCIATTNEKNYQFEGINDIIICTNDGSNQVVHPDIVKDNSGNYAVVCTPYPYGMEEYENPCLYYGETLEALMPVLCPLDSQSLHKQGCHMSDPSIAAIDSELYCIYRDTVLTEDYIYLKKIKISKGTKPDISERELLIHTKDDYVLSPAILLDNRNMYMYYVKTDRRLSQMVLNIYNRNSLQYSSTINVNIMNEPIGYFLWHIGISADNNSLKQIDSDTELKGLFLYINVADKYSIKLFTAINQNKDLKNWRIDREIEITDKIHKVMKFPYKSCFEPKTGGILLSFRDKKDRNRLVLLNTY